jgi:hypothetical protein
MQRFLVYLLLMFYFAACEKDISLDLPPSDSEIVVDGYVETGLPPYILLSQTSGYFSPIGFDNLVNDAITDAEVWLSDGFDTVRLNQVAINGIVQSGIYVALDSSTLAPLMIGVPGRNYALRIITSSGKIITSSAKLMIPVQPDSVWFRVNTGNDSLGLGYMRLDEPDTIENCYRIFTKRITKDMMFLPPSGSVFDDRFINGQLFDFAYNRGRIINSIAADDNNEEAGLFKKGDTIVVKFTSIDRGVFEFWRDAETQLSNIGSPFAVPFNIKSNINGGIGLFATYAPVYDTIIAR